MKWIADPARAGPEESQMLNLASDLEVSLARLDALGVHLAAAHVDAAILKLQAHADSAGLK